MDAGEMAYRVEWRHRSVAPDGRVREVTRARFAEDASALKTLAAALAQEAVGREFMVAHLGDAGTSRQVCVRAEELVAWVPLAGELPRGLLPTYWLDDEWAGAQRYRLLSVISRAFAEARELRLVGRHECRDIMVDVRRALLRA